jgi:thiol:disulfide interchange protein
MKQGYTIFFLATLLAGSFLYYRFAISSYDNIPTPKGIYFENSFEMAQIKAKETGRPLLLSFYGSWCSACKKMKKEVYANEKLGRLYGERFVAVNVDGESEEGFKLRERFRVNAYPTLIWFFGDEIILKETGYIEKDIFHQKSTTILKNIKTYYTP